MESKKPHDQLPANWRNSYSPNQYEDLRTRETTRVNSGVPEPRNPKHEYLRAEGTPRSRENSHPSAPLFCLDPNGLVDASTNHTDEEGAPSLSSLPPALPFFYDFLTKFLCVWVPCWHICLAPCVFLVSVEARRG